MSDFMQVYHLDAGKCGADQDGWYIVDGDAIISGPFDCEEEALDDLDEMLS